ncbi:MAG TPA: hypothetical protein VIP11_20915 [Gemmatimonadaceae bacterium]
MFKETSAIAAPHLTVRIKKKTDGSAALSCQRADGSVTWQRQDGDLGAFFPLHDLTHFAVETALGFRHAFYGLVADGWDISSFEAPGAARRIPEEAGLAELIVGFFDVERATGIVSTAADFNWKIDTHLDERGLPPTPFRMTDERLEQIRSLRGELFARWRDVQPGDTLELRFTPGSTAVPG